MNELNMTLFDAGRDLLVKVRDRLNELERKVKSGELEFDSDDVVEERQMLIVELARAGGYLSSAIDTEWGKSQMDIIDQIEKSNAKSPEYKSLLEQLSKVAQEGRNEKH